MKTVSKSKITALINNLSATATTMDEDKKNAMLNALAQIPIQRSDINSMKNSKDEDVSFIADKKDQQRYFDAESVLEEAVENNVESVEQLCEFLGISPDSSFEDILYHAHAYKRIGKPGSPAAPIVKE